MKKKFFLEPLVICFLALLQLLASRQADSSVEEAAKQTTSTIALTISALEITTQTQALLESSISGEGAKGARLLIPSWHMPPVVDYSQIKKDGTLVAVIKLTRVHSSGMQILSLEQAWTAMRGLMLYAPTKCFEFEDKFCFSGGGKMVPVEDFSSGFIVFKGAKDIFSFERQRNANKE